MKKNAKHIHENIFMTFPKYYVFKRTLYFIYTIHTFRLELVDLLVYFLPI